MSDNQVDAEPLNLSRTTVATSPSGDARYNFGEEIARGGRGVICRATDSVLGREVAVKVLHEKFGPSSGAARRFHDEARIAAQLQHPAIPPVHDMGALADGRPFLAMKLIEGDALDHLLKELPDPAHNRGRFIAVFEQICQAVGFAHSRGIIHRDLKPRNVMVGAFGEVQAMDWGIAKDWTNRPHERASRPFEEAERTEIDPEETTDHRPTDESTDDRTRHGQAIGTPSYMPLEQARGDLERIDRRSDVFALGGILCVILTGKPPYTGGGVAIVIRNAAEGNLADAWSRLDATGADAELVALCKRCLSVEPANRPVDGGTVAMLVAEYRSRVEERLRTAERERAAAEAKAREQRKKRRVQLALAFAIVVLLGGGGVFAWYSDRQATAERGRLVPIRRRPQTSSGRADHLAAQPRLFRDIAGPNANRNANHRAIRVRGVLERGEGNNRRSEEAAAAGIASRKAQGGKYGG
jgi:eukaryotic-like serine/threonine-protein kinase